jgi:HK97 family phage prohead protease
MTMKRKFLSGAALKDETLGERQIRVIASTPTPDRVKDVMLPEGCDLTHYRDNPIVLFNHDPKTPIGTAQVEVKNGRVEALITYAPAGASEKADEVCALSKSGVLNTVSVGFEPVEAEALRGGGERIKKWSLLEISIVSVPCNPDALVIGRSLTAAEAEKWKVGASRNLPLETKAEWRGDAAAAAIFEKAGFGGEAPDTTFARKAFLVYDSAAPGETASYAIPFADLVDGRLKASAAGVRAAAALLPQMELPPEAAKKARELLDHYEAKMQEAGAAPKPGRKMMIVASRKDLYSCRELAYALQSLISLALGADWERDYEGDDSALPEQLAALARSAGEALIAMTEEETNEALASLSDLLPAEQKSLVATGSNPRVKLLRAAALHAKAGRAFSAANEKCIKGAMENIKSAHDALHGMFAPPSDDEGSEDGEAGEAGSDPEKAARLREIEILRLTRA